MSIIVMVRRRTTIAIHEAAAHDRAAQRDDLRAVVQGDGEPIRRGLAMMRPQPPLVNAEHLLERGDADAIEALSGHEAFARTESLRGLVAVAAGRLDPARAPRLLREEQRTLGDPPPESSTAFAAAFPADPVLLRWLVRDPENRCESETRAHAVIAGLVEAGAEGKKTLARFVADPTSDLEHRAVLVRLLAEAAISQGGAERDFECAEGLPYSRCLETSKPRVEAALAKALPVCLAKIRAWY